MQDIEKNIRKMPMFKFIPKMNILRDLIKKATNYKSLLDLDLENVRQEKQAKKFEQGLSGKKVK